MIPNGRGTRPGATTAAPAAAGTHVIAIPHPRYPPEPDALALAGLVLPSLAGLTPDAVSALG